MPSHSLQIRKLRKKLRQIESLENLCQPLSEDEAVKVSRKEEIRKELLRLLKNSEEKEQIQSNILVDLTPVASTKTHEPNEIKIDEPQNDLSQPLIPEKEEENTKPLKKTEKSKKKKKKAVAELKTDENVNSWKKKVFTLRSLQGHHDLITSAVIDGDLLVSCSRDTTVKVWNAATGQELTSLRGHTASVTCVVLVSEEASTTLAKYYKDFKLTVKTRLVISGGADCNVKIWSLHTGSEVKSIYTYNGITCLGFVETNLCLVTGTDGGKLELWDIVSGRNLQSLSTFDDCLNCIKVKEDFVYTASPDGIVRVWQLRDEELCLLFSSEDLLFNHVGGLLSRPISALEVIEDCLIYGDDGINLKIIDWKKGNVYKVRNHTCDFGATHAICRTGDDIISSSYDFDTGYTLLNVRHFGPGTYLGTLDGKVGRILTLSCSTTSSKTLCLVTAGKELIIWDELQDNDTLSLDQSDVVLVNLDPLYNIAPDNSDLESSATDTDDEIPSDEEVGFYERTYIPKEIKHSSSFWEWCTLL